MPLDLEHGTYKVWEKDGKTYVYVGSHWEEVELPGGHEIKDIKVYGGTERSLIEGSAAYVYLAVEPITASNTGVSIVASNNNVSWGGLVDAAVEVGGVKYNKRFQISANTPGETSLTITSLENPSVSVVLHVVVTQQVAVESIDTDQIQDEYTIIANGEFETYIPIVPIPSNATNTRNVVYLDPADPNNDGIWYAWMQGGGQLYWGIKTEPGYEGEYYYNVMVYQDMVKQIKITAVGDQPK